MIHTTEAVQGTDYDDIWSGDDDIWGHDDDD